MTALARLSLRFKTVTMLVVVLLLGAGAFSVSKLNQELFPSFDLPYLVVTAAQPGAGPAQVADGVARPIEDVVRSTQGLKHVSSTSLEGLTIVSAEYDYGTSMNERESQVRERLAAVGLPEGVTTPAVQRISPNSFPIYTMAVFGDDLAATEAYVDSVLLPEVRTAAGVAQATKTGGSQKTVSVVVDPAKLAARGLALADVSAALRDANLSVPVGAVAVEATQFPVRVASTPDSIDAVASLPLLGAGAPTTASPVTLRDVATVAVTEGGAGSTISRTDGRPSIGLEIVKEQSANTVETVAAVEKAIEDAPVPAGVEVAEVTNQAPEISAAVSDLARDAVIGGILAILMILVFLRSGRSTLVAGISIPLSLLVAFILMNVDNITLNILTLGALSVAAGRVIDDAIVVIENIHRLLETGMERAEAVIKGTSQMVPAITASTITTVAVFLPLAFVGGLVGEVFVGFALTVTFALLASLIVAVTVVPVMAEAFLKTDLSATHADPSESKLRAIYRRPLTWALDHRALTVAGAVVLLFGSLGAATQVPTNLFPAAEATALSVSVNGPSGATLDAMSDVVAGLEADIGALPDVRQYTTVIGTSADPTQALRGTGSGSNSAAITVALAGGADSKELTSAIEAAIARSGLAGGVSVDTGFGGSEMSVQVTGDDFAGVAAAAAAVGERIQGVDGLKNVTTNVAGQRPELKVDVDVAKAARAGLSAAAVAAKLRSALSPMVATTVVVDGAARQVVVAVDPTATAGPDALAKLAVAPGVTLGSVATIVESSSPTGVTRYDGARSAEVKGIITSDNIGKVNTDVQAAIDEVALPEGVAASLGGAAAAQSESFGALGLAMLIAVFLVYLAMVTTFGSLLTPFVILLSLPLAVIGAFPALLVTGRELGLPAMLGLLMLIGIVVTNAIVMLEFVERLRRQGYSTREALLEGAQTRLRPILMTAIVTILALTPLAMGLSQGALLSASLATVVIGGLISSTLLTLVVIPVVYSLFDGLKGLRRGGGPAEVSLPDSTVDEAPAAAKEFPFPATDATLVVD